MLSKLSNLMIASTSFSSVNVLLLIDFFVFQVGASTVDSPIDECSNATINSTIVPMASYKDGKLSVCRHIHAISYHVFTFSRLSAYWFYAYVMSSSISIFVSLMITINNCL